MLKFSVVRLKGHENLNLIIEKSYLINLTFTSFCPRNTEVSEFDVKYFPQR